jgi:hypothetical protein
MLPWTRRSLCRWPRPAWLPRQLCSLTGSLVKDGDSTRVRVYVCLCALAYEYGGMRACFCLYGVYTMMWDGGCEGVAHWLRAWPSITLSILLVPISAIIVPIQRPISVVLPPHVGVLVYRVLHAKRVLQIRQASGPLTARTDHITP